MEEKTDDMQQVYARAVSAHESDDLAAAAEGYGKILARFPDADVVLYNQGLALFGLERFSEAAAVFTRAADLRQDDADTWYNLGLALKRDQQYSEAVNAYQQALALQADDPDLLFNLANCCQESGDAEQAGAHYARLLELNPEHESALNNFAYLCHRQQDYAQAEQLYQRLLELQPEHPGALHMLAALRGTAESTPENAYVRDLFDQYSDSFEQSLVEKLEYRVPDLLFDLVRRVAEDRQAGEGRPYQYCLDLGCGTGLAGKIFTDTCKHLVGVDVSEKMLAQAAQKGVYDRLVADDAVRFPEQEEQQYNLLVAADLLTYLADLEPLLLAANQRTVPDGIFAFSTEHGEQEKWQVRPTGRFAHHPDYVTEVAEQSGWRIVASEEADLRREGKAWVRGDLFVLMQPGQSFR